jgi:transposase
MLRRQAFKFERMPNGQQTRNLRRFAGSCRFVYNKALALNIERCEKKDQRLGYAELCALLPNWKREHEFLSDVPAQALQQALKNLESAYTNFFQKRADFPKFKKTGQHESFRIPQGFEVDNQNGRIKLPKLGWMRYRKESPSFRGPSGRGGRQISFTRPQNDRDESFLPANSSLDATHSQQYLNTLRSVRLIFSTPVPSY